MAGTCTRCASATPLELELETTSHSTNSIFCVHRTNCNNLSFLFNRQRNLYLCMSSVLSTFYYSGKQFCNVLCSLQPTQSAVCRGPVPRAEFRHEIWKHESCWGRVIFTLLRNIFTLSSEIFLLCSGVRYGWPGGGGLDTAAARREGLCQLKPGTGPGFPSSLIMYQQGHSIIFLVNFIC